MRPVLLLAVLAAACHRTGTDSATSPSSSGAAIVAPDGSPVPAGALGRSVLRGQAILGATRDSLPDQVGAALNCTSCHLGDGRRRDALPLTGVYAHFPQYRARAGTVQQLEDRINDCLLRSMNGHALGFDDPAMRDIVAYLAFISRGVVVGDADREPAAGPVTGDTLAGGQVYRARCARCHGPDGAGTVKYPPLWGRNSFNIGAGMARLRTAAAFIRRNMPQDAAGSLGDIDARNVAAYITSRPRPDFPGKEHDWPLGGAPADAPYRTLHDTIR